MAGNIHRLATSPKTRIMADSIIKMLEKDSVNKFKISSPPNCYHHKVSIWFLANISSETDMALKNTGKKKN